MIIGKNSFLKGMRLLFGAGFLIIGSIALFNTEHLWLQLLGIFPILVASYLVYMMCKNPYKVKEDENDQDPTKPIYK